MRARPLPAPRKGVRANIRFHAIRRTVHTVNVVILAAGQGKRMHSDLPKVMHALAGKPLLGHVIDCARELEPQRICVVYGHGGESVREAFAARGGAEGIVWVLQEPQLGTGHAVMQALPHLSDTAPTLVLYVDVPLIRAATFKLLCPPSGSGMSVLTAELRDPVVYGPTVLIGGALAHIVDY